MMAPKVTWGLICTAAPVGWWTWLSKMLPEDAERAGRLNTVELGLQKHTDEGGPRRPAMTPNKAASSVLRRPHSSTRPSGDELAPAGATPSRVAHPCNPF